MLPGSACLYPADSNPDFRYFFPHKLANQIKCEEPEAMAAIEADDLTHRREWIDPSLETADLERIDQRSEVLRGRHRRSEMLWRVVGAIAIILLIVYGTIL